MKQERPEKVWAYLLLPFCRQRRKNEEKTMSMAAELYAFYSRTDRKSKVDKCVLYDDTTSGNDVGKYCRLSADR